MSSITKLHSTEQRYDEASLWIERLDEGLTTAETTEFKAWMAANPRNEALLLKMAGLWDKMDTLSRLSTLFPEPPIESQPRSWPRVAAAASVLVAIAAIWAGIEIDRLPFANDDEQTVQATADSVFETAVGEHSTVVLQDGTELVLNTNSRVRVTFTPEYRLLILESGEVHVQVAEDLLRPLSVIAGNNIVQAVGTVFNVEITDDQRIELVVTEGKVRVGVQSRAMAGNTSPTPAVLPPTSVEVEAGEELILGEAEEVITPVSEADVEVKLSWRKGNLIFRGESLEDTIAEVERYTAVEFVIVDEDLKKLRVSGFFKAGDVHGMLAVLRENFDIVYERVDENRVLLSAL